MSKKKGKRSKNVEQRAHVVLGNDGEPCPRCGLPTEIRAHRELKPKHLQQPYYYSRWYNCTNRQCRTSLIMPKDFIVWKDSPAARQILGEPAGFLG